MNTSDMTEPKKLVENRNIDSKENFYINNRDNPNWPLAVNISKSNRAQSPLVSMKQKRGIRHGQ